MKKRGGSRTSTARSGIETGNDDHPHRPGGPRAGGGGTLPPPAAPSLPTSTFSGIVDPILAELVEQITGELQAGVSIDFGALSARFPGHAEALRDILPALRQLAALGLASSAGPAGAERATSLAFESGRRLGDFRLIREMGRGGMGIVFEALQPSLGRRVAVKILPTAAVLDARALRRFQIEAQVAACFQHPHIVPVYAVELDHGVPYYAMQLVEGKSLADLIATLGRLVASGDPTRPGETGGEAMDPLLSGLLHDRFDHPSDAAGGNRVGSGAEIVAEKTESAQTPPSGRLSGVLAGRGIRAPSYFRAVARLGVQAAEALEYAHGQGILHRDIKPANLLIDRRGCLWVTDFGLARLPSDSGLTLTGELVGTVRYMSPEQARGEPSLIDRRTDIYSLGATLYELLTLRPAYGGSSPPETLRRIAESDPEPVRMRNPSVPTDLVTVVAKAMARDPSSRYLTAQHLADDLNRFLAGRTVAARPTSAWVRALKTARRRPGLTSLFLLVQVLVAAIVVLGLWSYRRIGREAEGARRLAESESRARAASQRTSAALALDRGLTLADGHQVARGLLWMLRGLETAPPQADDLRRVAATNLVAWGEHMASPRHIVSSAGPLSAFGLSPDGRIVALGGDDGMLILWDADTGRRIESARTAHVKVGSIRFHPEGRILATVGREGSAQLWDVRPLRPRGDPIPMATRVVNRMGFDPTGRAFLTTGAEGSVLFLDVQTGRPSGPRLDTRDLMGTSLLGVAFRPDGRRMITFGRDGGRFWDAITGRVLSESSRQGVGIATATFSPDGSRVATAENGEAEGQIRVWNSDDGRLVAESPRFAGGFFVLAFHPDGRTIAASGRDGIARLFDAATGQVRGRPMSEGGHVNDLAYSPDGRLLATGSDDGTVWMFDPATGRPLGTTPDHGGPLIGLIFRPDGRELVTASRDGSARVWDIAAVADPGRAIPLASVAVTAELSPDGRLLAIDGVDGAARVFDIATGRPVLPPLLHAWGRVRLARFSPDGRRLATGGDDAVVRIWDVATGAPVGQPLPQPSWPLNAQFSPDGRRLLVGHTAGTARLWDVASSRPIGPLLRHPVLHGHEIANVAFDATGRIAMSGSVLTDGSEADVGFWDSETGRPLAPFARFSESVIQMVVGRGPHGPLYVVEGGRVHTLDLGSLREVRPPIGQRIEAVALLPGGTKLLAGRSDKAAQLLDVATGQPIGPIMEHDEPVRAVAVSPDGTTLLTLAGQRLHFWLATTGKRLGPPRVHRGLAPRDARDDRQPVFFSPDGRTAVSVGGSVVLWDSPGPAPGWASGATPRDWSINARTGMELDDLGNIRTLDAPAWERLLASRGNSRSARIERSPADWHDRLAAEAERSVNAFTARWHLDRLAAARPDDWTAAARRSRVRRREDDEAAATDDDPLAEGLDPAGPARIWAAHEDFDRAVAAAARGRWSAARAHLNRLRERTGETPALLWKLAEADIRLGRWNDAEVEVAAAIDSLGGPCLESAFYASLPSCLAALRLRNGHHDLYRDDSRKLIEWSGEVPTTLVVFCVVWQCSVGPDALDDPMVPVRIAEKALARARGTGRRLILAALGMALHRAGRGDEAVTRLEEAERDWGGDRSPLMAFLAMANQARGRPSEARRWLDRLRARTPIPPTNWNAPWDELEVDNLRREAEAVVVLDPAFPRDPFGG